MPGPLIKFAIAVRLITVLGNLPSRATLFRHRGCRAVYGNVRRMHYLGNREPTLDELLCDPIVRLVMARDSLSAETVRAHFEAVRRTLRRRRSADAKRCEQPRAWRRR